MQDDSGISSPVLVLEHDLSTLPSVKIGPLVYGHQVTDRDPRDPWHEFKFTGNLVNSGEIHNSVKFGEIRNLVDTAARCNTLQHTATHCNTKRHITYTICQ